MNEELNKRLINSIDKIAEWTEKAESFAVEHAPQVVNEILAWGVSQSITIVVLIIVPLVVAAITAIRMRNKTMVILESNIGKNYPNKDDPFGYVAVGVSSAVIVFFLCGALSHQLLILIKIHTAPRLYVIDQLSNLL